MWRLVKLTGWTIDQIDSTSAVELDWLLAIESEHVAAQNAAQEAASRA